MNRVHLLAVSVLAAGVVLASAPSFAQGPRSGPDGVRGRGGLGVPVRALNLSEAQRTQIQTIRSQYQVELRQAGERFRDARRAQRAAIHSSPVDEALVRVTTQAVASADTDLALVQARIYNDVWLTLTPEQQARVTAVQTRREPRQLRRDRGRPRLGGQ